MENANWDEQDKRNISPQKKKWVQHSSDKIEHKNIILLKGNKFEMCSRRIVSKWSKVWWIFLATPR